MKTDDHLCLSAYQPIQEPRNWKIQLKECGQYESEYWDYNFHRKSFYHRESGLCLDQPFEDPNDYHALHVLKPTLSRCTRGELNQQWILNEVRWLSNNVVSSLNWSLIFNYKTFNTLYQNSYFLPSSFEYFFHLIKFHSTLEFQTEFQICYSVKNILILQYIFIILIQIFWYCGYQFLYCHQTPYFLFFIM